MTAKHHASDTTMPSIARPNHAECSKTLLMSQSQGTLCTHSAHQTGYPFGSMMPYALDDQACPIFLISSMAMHTQNILHNPKVSLYVAETRTEAEALGSSRLTCVGDVQRIEDDCVRQAYLAAHPNAQNWVDFSDFSFYHMQVQHVYFVGGFGVMGWLSAEDYVQAAADPLRHAAAYAMQHMNASHADALVLLVRAYANKEADAVHMLSLDRLGFDVKVTLGEHARRTRIAFAEPLENPDDIRPVLVKMVQQAREKLAC